MKAAREALEQAQERQKRYTNQHRHHIEFSVSDEVLLLAKNINTLVNWHCSIQKLVPKFIGLYKVAKVIPPMAYKLELPPSFKLHPVFHVSLLKQYNRQNNYPIPQPPPLEIINGQQEWEVEEILNKKTIRRKVFYLVKWKSYPLHEATWEPVENLENCDDLRRKFKLMRTSNS